jgi:hypothetical protein
VFVENDVVDYATTDAALEDLLHQAAAFGSAFVPPAIEANPPLGPSTTPTSQTNEDDASSRTQRSGSPESQGDYMADVIMTGEEPMATQGEQDAPAAVVIGLEKNHHNYMMEVVLMNVGSCPTVAKVLDCMRRIDNHPMQALYRHLQQIPPESALLSTSKRPVAMKDLAVERASWGIHPKMIGLLEEAQTRALEPCMACPEMDSIRDSLTPPIVSSIPIMVLYIERQVSRSSLQRKEVLTGANSIFHRTKVSNSREMIGCDGRV